jgi:hypothetical protein
MELRERDLEFLTYHHLNKFYHLVLFDVNDSKTNRFDIFVLLWNGLVLFLKSSLIENYPSMLH